MHEFSIAQNILEIAEKAIQENNRSKVTTLTLEIGSMAGIELSSLEMALEIIQKGTILENAEIKIANIPARAKCNACSHLFEPIEIFDPCPVCSNFGITILSGKELIVKSIEAE